MPIIYDNDSDDVQAQLAQALKAADQWRTTASGLWKALHGLRAALDACPSDEDKRALRETGEQLQQAHQQAHYTAEMCAEAVRQLTKRLAQLADDNLRAA